ncbi:hypothetical protein D3C85_1873270 [compost metagenome]
MVVAGLLVWLALVVVDLALKALRVFLTLINVHQVAAIAIGVGEHRAHSVDPILHCGVG